MNPLPLRVGIVGMGTIGSLYAELLLGGGHPDVELAGVVEPGGHRTPGGVRRHEDLVELLCRDDVDAVALATPPHLHHPMAMASLRAGKHVLVEKPPALSTRQVREMDDEARRRGKVLFAAFHTRYGPAVTEARNRLHGQEIRSVDITYRENAFRYHHPDSWVFDPRRSGGGVVIDSGINAVSVVTAVTTLDALFVDEARLGVPGVMHVETRADVAFRWAGGGRGRLTLDWLHEGEETREITFGTARSRLVVDVVRQRLVVDDTAVEALGDASRTGVDQAEEYARLLPHFVRAVLTGRSYAGEVELGFVEAVYRRAGWV